MKTVRELLETKGSHVWSVSSDSSVLEAAKRMSDHNVGALLVVDAGQVAGIISERDLVRRVVARGKSCKDTPLSEAMTAEVISVRPDDALDDCNRIMLDRGIRHLPVISGGKPVGMVSLRDVVQEYLMDQEAVLASCERNQDGKSYDL